MLMRFVNGLINGSSSSSSSSCTHFVKVSVSHTGRGLRVSSAHAAAAGISGPVATSGKERTGEEHAVR